MLRASRVWDGPLQTSWREVHWPADEAWPFEDCGSTKTQVEEVA